MNLEIESLCKKLWNESRIQVKELAMISQIVEGDFSKPFMGYVEPLIDEEHQCIAWTTI